MEKIDNPKSNPDHPQDYSDEEIIEMIYDMEEASNYVVPFDQLSIFSQNMAEGTLEKGQVINMVMSQSLQGEVYQNIGDTFTYCLTSQSEKIFGNLKFKPHTCQMKFKMRAVASMNKVPGFPKFSAYKQMNLLGPSVIASQPQVANILSRIEERYPEFGETR